MVSTAAIYARGTSTMVGYSVPKRPARPVGTARTAVLGVPGMSQAVEQERPTFGRDSRVQ